MQKVSGNEYIFIEAFSMYLKNIGERYRFNSKIFTIPPTNNGSVDNGMSPGLVSFKIGQFSTESLGERIAKMELVWSSEKLRIKLCDWMILHTLDLLWMMLGQK